MWKLDHRENINRGKYILQINEKRSFISFFNLHFPGALIENSGSPWAVMFGKTGQVNSTVSYEFDTDLSNIKNLVTDLQPSTSYTITISRNGVPTTQIMTSSSEGTLYFTT